MTVQHYVDANNGLLGKLGNQEGVKDKLKERYGDWDDPERTEDERKQSAYNASRHVGMIEHKRSAAGEDRGEFARDGKLDGSTDSGEIREGTEMADLKDSLKGDTLEEQNANTDRILGYGGLNETNDEWVNANGSTRDNSEVHGQRAGEFFEGFGQGFTSVFASLLGIK